MSSRSGKLRGLFCNRFHFHQNSIGFLFVFRFSYMVSTFFSSASIGSVSTAILFLMTYMPYILIVTLDTLLNMWSKAATVSSSLNFYSSNSVKTNLFLSPVFCRVYHLPRHFAMLGVILCVWNCNKLH